MATLSVRNVLLTSRTTNAATVAHAGIQKYKTFHTKTTRIMANNPTPRLTLRQRAATHKKTRRPQARPQARPIHMYIYTCP